MVDLYLAYIAFSQYKNVLHVYCEEDIVFEFLLCIELLGEIAVDCGGVCCSMPNKVCYSSVSGHTNISVLSTPLRKVSSTPRLVCFTHLIQCV